MKPNNFDDYADKLKKVKLDPSRKNLKPVDEKLTLEQQIALAVKEGNELLEAAGKTEKPSVKPPSKQSKKLEDALGKMSDNPYVRARIEVLQKMSVKERASIERWEKEGDINHSLYDLFVHKVAMRGDQLSGLN